MMKGVWIFLGEPTAIFQMIMDATLPLSMGPNEVAFLLLAFTAAFIGFAYSKRVRVCIDYLWGRRIG